MAGSPSASATDYYRCGSYCDGKNPATTKFWDDRNHRWYTCAEDARTIYKLEGLNHPLTELRYSFKCETAWTRIERSTGGYAMKVDSFWSQTTSRRVTYEAISSSPGSAWTAMVNDACPKVARACVYIPYGDWKCTSKY